MVPVRFHIHTSRLLRSLAGTCISLALCFLLYTVLDVNVLDHLAPQDDEADVINYFYSIENRGPDTEAYSCFYDDRIVLFDLEGEPPRRIPPKTDGYEMRSPRPATSMRPAG